MSDRYFCSAIGPTFPNRAYFLAGTSFGHLTPRRSPSSPRRSTRETTAARSDARLNRSIAREGCRPPATSGARGHSDEKPVTANHLSSLPAMTKTIGATHSAGSCRSASMSESPEGVAGKPGVVTLVVTT
jgi:hypothetical protein